MGGCGRPGASRRVLSFSLRTLLTEPPSVIDVAYWGTKRTCRPRCGTSAFRGWSQLVNATLYLKGEMECALMGQRFHRGFTAAEKTELWDRWKRGGSLKAIGRAFWQAIIVDLFFGGSASWDSSARRRRSRLALTLPEREVISRGVTAHQSVRSIARLLGRSPSTVSREMSRNGGYHRYRATLADIGPCRDSRPIRFSVRDLHRG